MGFFIRGAVILVYALFIFCPDFRVTYSFNSIISSTVHKHEKLTVVSAVVLPIIIGQLNFLCFKENKHAQLNTQYWLIYILFIKMCNIGTLYLCHMLSDAIRDFKKLLSVDIEDIY